MNVYRKIWTANFGEIPKDENGIPYDIHHIDGNRNNNDISNLKAVSVKEHYEIHRAQGDWQAAHYISQRMNLSLEERIEINKKIGDTNRGNKNGMWGKKHTPTSIQKMRDKKLGKPTIFSKKETNPIYKQKNRDLHKEIMLNKNPMHNEEFVKKVNETKRKKKEAGYIREYKIVNCPHCNKLGGINNMNRYHFNNCKLANK